MDKLIARLEDARNRSTLKTASFSTDPEKDKEIKEAIRLWATTWITYPLNEVIEELKRGQI